MRNRSKRMMRKGKSDGQGSKGQTAKKWEEDLRGLPQSSSPLIRPL